MIKFYYATGQEKCVNGVIKEILTRMGADIIMIKDEESFEKIFSSKLPVLVVDNHIYTGEELFTAINNFVK